MSKRDLSILLIGIVSGGLAVGGAMHLWQPMVRIYLAARLEDSRQPDIAPDVPLPDRARSRPNVDKPSFGLEGYCPVTLMEHQRWMMGSEQFRETYGDQVFLFAGAAEQKRFRQAPCRYAPAYSGNDIVIAKNKGEAVRGTRKHGIFYDQRVLLFATGESLAQFSNDPSRYLTDDRGEGFIFSANGVVDLSK